MFQNPRGVYGVIGVMLFLIAMYLVLEHGTAASTIISSVGNSGSTIFKTLQGR